MEARKWIFVLLQHHIWRLEAYYHATGFNLSTRVVNLVGIDVASGAIKYNLPLPFYEGPFVGKILISIILSNYSYLTRVIYFHRGRSTACGRT